MSGGAFHKSSFFSALDDSDDGQEKKKKNKKKTKKAGESGGAQSDAAAAPSVAPHAQPQRLPAPGNGTAPLAAATFQGLPPPGTVPARSAAVPAGYPAPVAVPNGYPASLQPHSAPSHIQHQAHAQGHPQAHLQVQHRGHPQPQQVLSAAVPAAAPATSITPEDDAPDAGAKKGRTRRKKTAAERDTAAPVAGNTFAALLLEDDSVAGAGALFGKGARDVAAARSQKEGPVLPSQLQCAKTAMQGAGAAAAAAGAPPIEFVGGWKPAKAPPPSVQEQKEKDQRAAEQLSTKPFAELIDRLGHETCDLKHRRSLMLAVAKQASAGRVHMQNRSREWGVALDRMMREIVQGGELASDALEAISGIATLGDMRLSDQARNQAKDVFQAPKFLSRLNALAEAGEVCALLALEDLQTKGWFRDKKRINNFDGWSTEYESSDEDERRTGRLDGAVAAASAGKAVNQKEQRQRRLLRSLRGIAKALHTNRGSEDKVRGACRSRLRWLSQTVSPPEKLKPLSAAAKKAALPSALLVTSARGQEQCSGEYQLIDKIANGFGVWKKNAGNLWLYSGTSGMWQIGGADVQKKDFVCDLGFIYSDTPHKNSMPNEVPGSWKRWNGKVFQDDPSITVVQIGAKDGGVPQSAWASMEVVRSLLDCTQALGPSGQEITVALLRQRPDAMAILNQCLDSSPSFLEDVHVVVPILTQLAAVGAGGGSSASSCPVAVGCIVQAAGAAATGQNRSTLLGLLRQLNPRFVLDAGAARVLVPQLAVGADADLFGLMAHLIANDGANEVVESGIWRQLHDLLDAGHERVVAQFLDALVTSSSAHAADVVSFSLGGPRWLADAESLLLRLLRPGVNLDFQISALHAAGRLDGSTQLPPIVVRIAEVGQPAVRIEALSAALMLPLSRDLATRVAQVVISALSAPKMEVRAKACGGLAEAARARRVPYDLFAEHMLQRVMECARADESVVVRKSALACLLQFLSHAPEAEALRLLSSGTMALIESEALAGNLEQKDHGVWSLALGRAIRLGASSAVKPVLKAWLAGDNVERKLLAANIVASEARAPHGAQRLLDSGVFSLLFGSPVPQLGDRAAENAAATNGGSNGKKGKGKGKGGQHGAQAPGSMPDMKDVRVVRTVTEVAMHAMLHGSKEQQSAVAATGAPAWLCAGLELEIFRTKQAKASVARGQPVGYARDEDKDVDDDVEAEIVFLEVARAIEAVLALSGQTELSMIQAFKARKALKGELRSLTYRKDKPELQTTSVRLGEKMSQETKKLQVELMMCQKCKDDPPKCNRCKGVGFDKCFKCNGEGKVEAGDCQPCKGLGLRKDGNGACPKCKGSGTSRGACEKCEGQGKWQCNKCWGAGKPVCKACQQLRRNVNKPVKLGREPKAGAKIAQCTPADFEMLRKMWSEERGGSGELVACWSVDNPKLSWRQRKRQQELKDVLGKDPDELRGYHGTSPENILSIVQHGFDSGKRAGQAYGAGEYFAKCPEVSKSYCRGGNYMIVCQLLLGSEATDPSLGDGDHIWVPDNKYYVISNPQQVVPLYIVQWTTGGSCNEALRKVLDQPEWSSIAKAEKKAVPANREMQMSADATNGLWIGYLDPANSEEQLQADLSAFLLENLPEELQSEEKWQLQIVRGRYTQAKVRLQGEVSREVVVGLNECTFVENGTERTITVDDSHGSPKQKCPRSTAQYCRGRNLRFVDPCWCRHEPLPTEHTEFELVPIDLHGAKGDEIVSKFMKTAPFHDGAPTVIAINAIQNEELATLHDKYRAYLRDKNKEEPKVVELFHGTNNNILDTVYTHGLQPPSDARPSEDCEVSGGKGLHTTLCDNKCKVCVEKHVWKECHMYGLGIYLADQARKSHRYSSEPASEDASGKRIFRMVSCSVAMGRNLELDGHLKTGPGMHDVFSLRGLWKGELEELVTLNAGKTLIPEGGPDVEQHDLLFVKGLENQRQQGLSVYNSEFISFHPYQCLPRYEIVYEV